MSVDEENELRKEPRGEEGQTCTGESRLDVFLGLQRVALCLSMLDQ
jgi:hypothetical protein